MKHLNNAPQFNIWEGIYQNFSEITESADSAVDETVFSQSKWQTNAAKKLNEELTHHQHSLIMQDYPLAVVAAMVAPGHQKINILDFGGGLANNYLALQSAVPRFEDINYFIVETKETCAMGGKLLNHYKNLSFHQNLDTIDNLETQFNIVHIGSTLQYIKHWQALLTQLASFKAQYFVFSDLMAGDIPTFAAKQYYYGKYIPTWFWDLKEVITEVKRYNYQLLFKAQYLGKFLNQRQALPMDNFPAPYRLKHAHHLIFSYVKP